MWDKSRLITKLKLYNTLLNIYKFEKSKLNGSLIEKYKFTKWIQIYQTLTKRKERSKDSQCLLQRQP